MLVELSYPLDESTPPYPGDPAYACKPLSTTEKDGCTVHAIELCTHTGTHIDAPSHFVLDGKNVDELPLEELLDRRALLVDFTCSQPNPFDDSYIIEAEHPLLVAALSSPASKNGVLLLKTGWSKFWGTVQYNSHPFLSRRAAQAIFDAGVKLLGVDTFSPDSSEGDFDAHKILLGAGVPIIENLNMDGLDAQSQWTLSVVPLRLRGMDGSPVRAFARKL